MTIVELYSHHVAEGEQSRKDDENALGSTRLVCSEQILKSILECHEIIGYKTLATPSFCVAETSSRLNHHHANHEHFEIVHFTCPLFELCPCQ